MQVLKIALSITMFWTFAAFAQEPVSGPQPLTFQTWKDQQVLEAQNQVLRVSARMQGLKSSKSAPAKKDASAPNSKLKVTSGDTLTAAEQDLKRAQESLSNANGLQFEDYVAVYIPTLADQPDALQKLSERLSKEELGAIFKGIMKAKADGDAKRNAALLDGLTSAGPKAQ